MRTTIRIDDELLVELKEQATRDHIPLTRLLNKALRAGMQSLSKPARQKRPYREKTYSLGAPPVGLDRALALAGKLEDEELVRKLMLRK